jgi:hypothetical protein
MNSVMAIHPYKANGLWVFDDPAAGLRQEPFVAGSDTIIECMVEAIPNAERGFTLMFSAQPFPGFQVEFEWLRQELGGNWYYCSALAMEGWLPRSLSTLIQHPRRSTRSSPSTSHGHTNRCSTRAQSRTALENVVF